MMVSGFLKCLKNDFNLDSIPSHAFYHGEWDKESGHPSIPYLVYRLLFLVTFTSCAIFSVNCRSDLFEIYFTNWSLVLQALYGIFYFIYIVWRKWHFFWQRLRGRGQVRVFDAEQHVPGPMQDPDAVPDNKGHRKTKDDLLHPSSTPSRIKSINKGSSAGSPLVTSPDNVETGTPSKDLHPASRPSRSKSVNNGGGGGVVPAPSGHGTATTAIDDVGSLTIPEKVIWILMNVTQTIPFIVSFVYWIFIFDYSSSSNYELCRKIRNWYITHSATALFALADALMVAIPVRLTHFIFPATFISIFLLFSYIYELAGGMYAVDEGMENMEMKFIYKELNWKEYPGFACGFVVLSIFATSVFHTMICWGIYKIKLKIASSLLRKGAEIGP